MRIPAFRSLAFGRLFAVALSVLALSACKQPEPPEQAARPVLAVVATVDTGAAVWSLPGQVVAHETTPLSFRIDGKIIIRTVRTGDKVSAGQVLAELDPKQAQQNSSNARSQLQAAQQGLDFARRQLQRDRQQAKADLIAQMQLEQSQNTYAQAQAQHTYALQQAALASDRLGYTKLLADHDGVISNEHAQTGQNVGVGQQVYSLAWDAGFDVIIDVPQQRIAALQVGDTATVVMTALPELPLQAVLREISPMADPASRAFRVKLSISQPTADVRLGMTVNVTFEQAQAADVQPVYTLPTTALFHQDTDPAVWIITSPDNTLELRKVQVVDYGEQTVSLSSGVNQGDRILAKGVHTVAQGEQVRIIDPITGTQP